MSTETVNWQLGELVTLPTEKRLLKKTGVVVYEHIVGARYICVREDSENERGILVKALGRVASEYIRMVGGKPFCVDKKDELFEGDYYYGYPIPALGDVKEVLEIMHDNPSLVSRFEESSMHVNPQSEFWVSETANRLVILKKAQYYQVKTDALCAASDRVNPYRLSIVYFHRGKLIW